MGLTTKGQKGKQAFFTSESKLLQPLGCLREDVCHSPAWCSYGLPDLQNKFQTLVVPLPLALPLTLFTSFLISPTALAPLLQPQPLRA